MDPALVPSRCRRRLADILLAGGNPLQDLNVLAHPESEIAAVIKAGTIRINRF
ncbi:hypothetical protein [Saccharopolyspora hattusasensis]|uniref:hypothetical protein n=1 Tax=Saccharopolyspora hattusasensis TaxID=1128679 RepID=UPI003D98E66B